MATGRLPDPNTAPVTAKGDLYTYSTVPAKLAVGNNGETLVADSSASTGLRWQGNFAAGKNKIINGDFNIWQRGTSFTGSGYTADRFVYSGESTTISQQTFTPGTAPVAGYESQYFFRIVKPNSANTNYLFHRVEDVRTLAGQVVTFSVWAKAASGTPSIGLNIGQYFGVGGSSANEQYSNITLSTSWQRFTLTVTLPSMSGKTIASGSYVYPYISFPSSLGSNTIDLWGWQLEAGNVATAFQTATGTPAGELAACQRYYWRFGGQDAYHRFGQGAYQNTSSAWTMIPCPVPMRVAPTALDYSTIALYDYNSIIAVTGVSANILTNNCLAVLWTTAAVGAQYRPVTVLSNNSTSGYIGASAEL